MADLATLGFAIDSSPLARAKTAMQDMVPAAKGAQTATEAMVGAVNGAKAAADGLAGSAGRAGAGLAAQSATVTRLANEYKQLSDVQRRINATTGVTGLSLGGDRGADIAAYGREMDVLRAKFNPLFAAGQQYKATLAEINQAQRVGAISQKEYADAIMSTKVAFTAQVNSLRGVTDQQEFFNRGSTATGRAANDNAKAFQSMSFEAKNLSYQLVDVTQGLVSGQPVFQIFAQQAGQIGQVIATSPNGLGGLMKELGRSIAGLLTPMRLLTVGVVAIGAAVAATILSWKNYALQLDDVRRIADTTSTALSGLNSAAAIKGIGDDEFFSSMKTFSQNVYEAKINTGSLVTLLRANGTAASTVQVTFSKVADLVKNAKDDITRMNILQQAGLPATRQWLDFMSQGGAKLQLIAAGMKSLGGPDNDRLIEAAKRFDDKWNEAWRNISMSIKSFGLAAITAFESITNSTAFKTVVAAWQLFQSVRTVTAGLLGGGTTAPATSSQTNAADALRNAAANRSDVANSRVAGAFEMFKPEQQKATVDPNKLINDNRIAQQRISLLGDLATVDDQVRAKELELSAAWLQSGVSAGKYRDAILNAVRAQAEMSRVQQQASIGVFNLNDANKAAADTLQMWIDKKLLDPNNAQQMAAALNVLSRNTRDMADAAKVAGSNLPGLQQALNDATNVNKMIDQFATSSFSNVTTGLADIFDGTKSAAQGFADLGKTVVRALEEMIIKMYIVTPIFNALKGALGGGGLLSSILPGAGVTASANGNVFAANDNGISKYSNQVVSSPTLFAFANGIGLMGEAGAEAIMPLQRGPNGKLGVSANGGGSGAPVINIINQSSGKVEQGGTRQNSDGSIDVLIRDAVKGVMLDDASKNGDISKAFAARQAGFGAR